VTRCRTHTGQRREGGDLMPAAKKKAAKKTAKKTAKKK
jgi:hypothetical protein